MKLWDGEKYRTVSCSVEAATMTALGMILVADEDAAAAPNGPTSAPAEAPKFDDKPAKASAKGK